MPPDTRDLGCLISAMAIGSLLGLWKLVDIVIWVFQHVRFV